MLIEVTQRHINDGESGSCSLCPVALAVKEKLFDHSVFVGSRTIIIDGIDHDMPSSVIDFISNFDDDEPVEPFSFNLECEA